MFKVGDIVRHRFINAINGEDPGTHEVLWVGNKGFNIQIDFGGGEILVCRADAYELVS